MKEWGEGLLFNYNEEKLNLILQRIIQTQKYIDNKFKYDKQ